MDRGGGSKALRTWFMAGWVVWLILSVVAFLTPSDKYRIVILALGGTIWALSLVAGVLGTRAGRGGE